MKRLNISSILPLILVFVTIPLSFAALKNQPINTNALAAVATTPIPTPITPPLNRVFITSTTYNGNLGGLSGADTKCQERADAANLGGTWKAWLSTSTSSAANRLIHSTKQYRLLDLALLANNWSDLTDGSLYYLIDKTELGERLPHSPTPLFVWTGTNASGYYNQGSTCNNWTSGSGTDWGTYGQVALPDSQWSWISQMTCGNTLRLYCFEQIPETSPSPTATPSATLTPTPTPTPTVRPTVTPTPTPTIAPTATPTATPTPTLTPTPTPTAIPVPGLAVNPASVNLTIQRGSKSLAYIITSTGANGFVNYGYPTSYGPGINTTPASGGLTFGSSVQIYIEVNLNVPAGTYSGTQTVKNSQNNAGVIIPVTIKVVESPVPTPSPRPVPCGKFGDVNNDNKISVADQSLITNYLSGKSKLNKEALKRADVNGDGAINLIDISLINNYLNGSISTFPICLVPTPTPKGRSH